MTLSAHDARSFDWPLTPDSVVFEVGGYKGRWAQEIARRYDPRLYVFEPQFWAYKECCLSLASWPKAHVFAFGLGTAEESLTLGDYETDGASFFKSVAWCEAQGRKIGYGWLQEIGSFLDGWSIDRTHGIDLMLVNAEGYEFELIPHMLKSRITPRWLMYQSHPGIRPQDNDDDLRRFLREKGYCLMWDYGIMLSAWERA